MKYLVVPWVHDGLIDVFEYLLLHMSPRSFLSDFASARALCNAAHYFVPHVAFVVRTRVMCQAGRACAAGARRRGHIVAWLCEGAPLWVVVHVCALLREY